MIETIVMVAGFIGLAAFATLYVAVSPTEGKVDLKTKFIIVLLFLLGIAMLCNTIIAVESLHELTSLRN